MKKIKLFLVLSIGSLLSVSCLVDDDVDQLGGGSTVLVGYPQTALTSSFVTDGDDKPFDVPVGIIGGNQGLPIGADVTLTYSLNPTASTATEGVEFDFASATRSVTIPAGSFSGTIPLTIHSGDVVVGDNKTIVINLASTVSQDGVVLATNNQTVVVTLVGACFSDLAGNYTVNYTSGVFPVVITEIGTGQYKSSVTPGYTQYDMYFSDVCGVLTLTDWYANEDYPISGGGTVTPAGNLAFTNVTLQGLYANRNYTYVKQ